MYSPLLNSYIFICKIVICISIFLSFNTHHWVRSIDGKDYRGATLSCYDYGKQCYERSHIKRAILFCYIVSLLNFILELLNLLLLCKQQPSRINLVIEEICVVISIIFLLPSIFVCIAGFIVIIPDPTEQFDWSFYIFFLAIIISAIDFVCSLIRVISYCHNHSFRSNVITYTSNNNHETIHIQS